MARITAILFSLTVTLCFCIDPSEKSHDLWITRAEKVTTNPEWITDFSMKLNKIEKNYKSVELNLTFLQGINSDKVQCEMKVFQKSGGKWVKSPLDIAKKPCCIAMVEARNFYSCLQKTSNLPLTCPLLKGPYGIKDFDYNKCDVPIQMPPNLPEDYKTNLVFSIGTTDILRLNIYSKLKRRMVIW